MSEQVLAIIPARLASQRLPEKPLKDIAGKSLLQRVWERGKSAKLITRLVVATDSAEIEQHAKSFGAEVVMTSESITTGSQRVAAAAKLLGAADWDCIMNLQGDMPFISPALLDGCIDFHRRAQPRFAMSTVATPIFDEATFLSSSDVKVVVSRKKQALYFSRAPMPHSRDGDRMLFRDAGGESAPVFGFKHFGLYVFEPETLKEYEAGDLSPLEQVEKLEQLRLLEKGLRIGVHVVAPELTSNSIEVDTPHDLERSRRLAEKARN